MQVFTVNPELPKKAGKVKLEFYEPAEYGKLPQREKDLVYLPLYKDAEFNLLLDGRQFLYRMPDRRDPILFFGGTDEEPFLTRLDPQILQTAKGTVDGFFQALVPETVQRGAKVFQNPPRRQGDIFALPTNLSWETVKTLVALKQNADPSEIAVEGTKGMSVFNTRHRFTGMHAALDLPGLGGVLLAEGELKAPDHADVKLPRIHILRQAAFLFDPRKAD